MEVYESSLAKAYFTSKAVDEPFYCLGERRKKRMSSQLQRILKVLVIMSCLFHELLGFSKELRSPEQFTTLPCWKNNKIINELLKTGSNLVQFLPHMTDHLGFLLPGRTFDRNSWQLLNNGTEMGLTQLIACIIKRCLCAHTDIYTRYVCVCIYYMYIHIHTHTLIHTPSEYSIWNRSKSHSLFTNSGYL